MKNGYFRRAMCFYAAAEGRTPRFPRARVCIRPG
jgi:hypothetical protein